MAETFLISEFLFFQISSLEERGLNEYLYYFGGLLIITMV